MWKCSKCYLHFKNAEKHWEEAFPFLDNCIWIGCVDLFLLRRENLWRAVNVFTKSPKILHITKRDVLELNSLHTDQQIVSFRFQHFWSHWPCCFSKVPLKEEFFDIYLTMFFGIHNFGNTLAMRVIFYLKVFKIAEKIRENAFCFLDNCNWIGCVNLSLLRRENLWTAVNVLKNGPNILHITKRDFFQCNNYLHIDQ